MHGRELLLLHLALAACLGLLAGPPPTGLAQEPPRLVRPGESAEITLFRPDLSNEAVLGLKRDHPLAPALRLALDQQDYIEDNIRDYSCILIRRERVKGRLGKHEYIQAKVRHEQREGGEVVTPFSVYLKFLGPEAVKGREVLYVAGRHDGMMRVRRGGPRFGYITAWIAPDGEVALKGNRYPVTGVGIKHMVDRLIELARQELGRNACRVSFSDDARIDGRDCTCIEVFRPKPDDADTYQTARIFIDQQLRIPIHFESHDSVADDPDSLELVEQYTFRNVRLNVGFSDRDFDVENPAYRLQ